MAEEVVAVMVTEAVAEGVAVAVAKRRWWQQHSRS